MVFVFVWLTSLSMTISDPLQVAMFHSFYGWVVFQCVCVCVCVYHIFFIHSSFDGHLGCFCILAVVNSAAVNVGVHNPKKHLVKKSLNSVSTFFLASFICRWCTIPLGCVLFRAFFLLTDPIVCGLSSTFLPAVTARLLQPSLQGKTDGNVC